MAIELGSGTTGGRRHPARRRQRFAALSALVASASLLAIAGSASAAPPSPVAAYPQAGMADLGVCSGLSVATFKASADPLLIGLIGTPSDVIGTFKGLPPNTDAAIAQNQGTCIFNPALGTTGSVARITKFTAKLASSFTDCRFQVPAGTNGKYPLFGKVTWQLDFNDDTIADSKMDGYLNLVGSDTTAPRLVWVSGMVTKGEAAGAQIGGNLWRMMVVKLPVKELPGFYDQPTSLVFESGNGPLTAFSVAPGWGYNPAHESVQAPCPTSPGPPPFGVKSNVKYMAFGALSASQFGFGPTSAGFRFLN